MPDKDKADEAKTPEGNDIPIDDQATPAVPVVEMGADIDPVTNQPLTDFVPSGMSKKEAKMVGMTQDQMRGAGGNARVNAANAQLEKIRSQPDDEKAAQEHLKTVRATTKEMLSNSQFVDPAEYRAQKQAEVAAEAQLNRQKETIPGGRYKVGSVWVNAIGEEVDGPGKE